MAAMSSITGDRLYAATVRGSSDAGEAERQDALRIPAAEEPDPRANVRRSRGRYT